MSKWCNKCTRNDEKYVRCNQSCPIFGKSMDEVSEMYFALLKENKRFESQLNKIKIVISE